MRFLELRLKYCRHERRLGPAAAVIVWNPRGYDTTGIPFHSDGKTVIRERMCLDKADRTILSTMR